MTTLKNPIVKKEREIEKEILKKIPFVHSVLRALDNKKLTKEEVYKNYIHLRPGSKIKKIFIPPADIRTVDVYLKILTEHEYIKQDIAPWSEKGKAKVILYYILTKGTDFLNGKK